MSHSSAHELITGCRSCGNPNIETIISFGNTPLADGLLTEEQLEKPEHIVPLTLVFCPNCGLVQTKETVDPLVLFCRDYPYFSSTSKVFSFFIPTFAYFCVSITDTSNHTEYFWIKIHHTSLLSSGTTPWIRFLSVLLQKFLVTQISTYATLHQSTPSTKP